MTRSEDIVNYADLGVILTFSAMWLVVLVAAGLLTLGAALWATVFALRTLLQLFGVL
jgi:hypothetical protein